MTYSACDFTEDVFSELHRVGAIYEAECRDENLDDNQSLAADYALAGITRLVEVKDSLVAYMRALADFAAAKGIPLKDGMLCAADERARKALANIEKRPFASQVPQPGTALYDELLEAAKAAGFRVEQGGDEATAPELVGKWWWTVARAGWSGIEASPDEFNTEDDAWADAIRAHQDELAEEAAAVPSPTELTAADRAVVLSALKGKGLTITECITALAACNHDPFVRKARELVAGDTAGIAIDNATVTSTSDTGAWVLSWLWVSNDEAGVLLYPDLLERLLKPARASIAAARRLGKIDATTAKLRNDQADWLEDLVTNFADELDGIESETPIGEPDSITWTNGKGETMQFLPSDAISALLALARNVGLPTEIADQVEQFNAQYGIKLNAILTVI